MTVTDAEPTLPDLTPDAERRLRAADCVIAAVLATVAFALYFQVRHFEYIRSDDPVYVSQNWAVQRGLTWAGLRYAATAVVSSNWHPLTLVAEMVVVQLFGPGPGAMHLAVASLHAANVGLLYLWLTSATGHPWRAAAVAAIWGLHPLRVESVAWVSELKDVLCGLFWLLGLLAFTRYRRRPTLRRYWLVVASLLAALLAKPMAVTLPAILLLLDYWPLGPIGPTPSGGLRLAGAASGSLASSPPPAGAVPSASRDDASDPNARPAFATVPPDPRMRTKAWRNRLLELLPLVLVCAAVSGVTLLTQSRTGATGSLAAFPVPLRLTNAADACLHYLTATFVPTGLAFFYPHPGMLGLTVPASRWVTGVLVLVAVTVTAVWLRRARPYALVGWAWFLLTLVPVVGLVQVGFLARADRYTYLPSIGLLIAVVWACADVAARLRPAGPACATAAALVAAACLAVVTHVQLGYWRDGRALAERAEAVVPDNYLAREALALDALEHGRPADGLPLARSAAALSPHIAEVHDTLGQLYEATGQLRPAFDELAMAVRIAPRNPYVRDHLGHLLVRQRRDEDAATQFRRALALDPGLPDAHQSLGAILASRGSNPEAIAEYRAALALDPHFAAAHASLADALRAGGDLPAAADEYRAAVTDGCHDPAVEAAFVWLASLDPGCPLADLAGMAELADDACARTRPPQPFPFYARSLLLARLGRFDDAVASGERALALSRSSGQAALTAAIERRLAAYRQGRPDPLPDPAGLPTTTTGPTRAGTPEPTTMP